MKKALFYLLTIALCFALFACDDEINDPSGNVGDEVAGATEQTEGEALVLYDEEEGYTFINQNRFAEIVEVIELSADNWMDYIGVVTYTEQIVQTDAFGEIVSTETKTVYTLGAKAEKCYYFYDFAIEFKDKTTGEMKIYDRLDRFSEDFDLDQYECTRIKGKLCLIDVPKEAIMQGKDGIRYFIARYRDISYGPPMEGVIAGTDGYAVSGVVDILLNDLCK